jgi:hypothetical protein
MNMPGFSAGASLYETKEHYHREATHLFDAHGNNEVLAQSKAREDAQHVLDVLKIGAVHCEWREYCEGHMGDKDHPINCGIKEICYWWPW